MALRAAIYRRRSTDEHQAESLPTQATNAKRFVERKGFFIRTGSFLRSYVPGMRSYAAKKVMRPTDLGTVCIEMTMHRRGSNHTKKQQPIGVELHATV
jgi:hypothetical protein